MEKSYEELDTHLRSKKFWSLFWYFSIKWHKFCRYYSNKKIPTVHTVCIFYIHKVFLKISYPREDKLNFELKIH